MGGLDQRCRAHQPVAVGQSVRPCGPPPNDRSTRFCHQGVRPDRTTGNLAHCGIEDCVMHLRKIAARLPLGGQNRKGSERENVFRSNPESGLPRRNGERAPVFLRFRSSHQNVQRDLANFGIGTLAYARFFGGHGVSLTGVSGGLPAAQARRLSTTSWFIRSRVATEAEPRWGNSTT
jgi:hypothetical protein